MKVTKLAINRAVWACGGGESTDAQLLDDNGMMCCLGFYAVACGLDDAAIMHRGDYGVLSCVVAEQLPSELVSIRDGIVKTSDLHQKLVVTNDDDGISWRERENRIAALFARIDVEVTFVGEYLA